MSEDAKLWRGKRSVAWLFYRWWIHTQHQSPGNGPDVEEFIVSTAYDGKLRKLYWFDCLECYWPFLAPKYNGNKYRARKYCSQKCARLGGRNQIIMVCDLCKEEYKKKPSSFGNSKHGFYFCSRECKDKAQRLESNFPEIHPPHYGSGEGSYREIAFRHYLPKCNRCGRSEYPGTLKVHHKDRDRTNNCLGNLEILCPNCHDLEHFLSGDGMYSGGKPRGRGEIEITELLQSSVESLSLSASTNVNPHRAA